MGTTSLAATITENEKWKQQINDLGEENIRLKISLANILANNSHKYQIELLEHFQNRFLKMDEELHLLRHDVREQLHLLQAPGKYSNQQLKNIQNYQQRLEVKMIILREEFEKMSGDFNCFLENEKA